MIGRVAVPLIAAVVTLVLRMIWCEAPEPVGRQEVASACVDDLTLAFGRQGALRERHRKDLVRPKRVAVSIGRINDVMTIPGALIPEAIESHPGARREVVPRSGGFAQAFGKANHRAQRVVPERIDLDCLARPRRDDPVPYPGIHPGELDAGFA